MKKVLILAYTTVNLGDDIFVKMLCDRYKHVKFYIVTEQKYSTAFKNISNLTVINNRTRYLDLILHKLGLSFSFDNRKKIKLAKNADLTVNIGGSLFQENNQNWQKAAKKYEKIIDSSKRFLLIGANFGPYITDEYKAFYQTIFKKMTHISFRDKFSYNLFPELTNTNKAPDIILGLQNETDYNIGFQIFSNKYVIISVIDLEKRGDLSKYCEDYENAITKLGIELISRGYDVVLMSFCEEEGDSNAINRILNKNPKFKKYIYTGNITEALSIMKSAKSIVATRLHSLILAWVFDLPVFPIIYNAKMTNILNDFQVNINSIKIENIKNILIGDVIQQLETKSTDNLDIYKEKSLEHFAKLDQILNHHD